MLTKCDQCREMWAERNARGVEGDPPCEICRIELAPENEEIAEVYFQSRSQVIATQGQVVSLNVCAVKIIMDLLEIKDQRKCLRRVMQAFHHDLAKRQEDKKGE
ncbi:MAG: hypothetical protein ABFD12_01010 [Syntrophorhabdus sp.]